MGGVIGDPVIDRAPLKVKVTFCARPLKQAFSADEYHRPSPHLALADGRYETLNVCVEDASRSVPVLSP